MTKPIAICRNETIFKHSGSWSSKFVSICQEQQIPYEEVNGYSSDIISCLDKYSGLIWPIENWVLPDMMEGRNILQAASSMGLSVFPDHNTAWHFDDKIAQMYALQAVDAPIPKSWVFYRLEECLEWLEHAQYPIVAKLRCGSGATNVKLLKKKTSASRYARKMFGKGLDPSPSLLYKAYSKGQSARNWKTVLSRAKRIPEFLRTRHAGKQLPMEKGYCYFQEFVPNEGYDIKVAVVGEQLSFFKRDVRKGDFRASGGGAFTYEKDVVTQNVIDSAFNASEKLGLQCMGFDYVIDKTTGEEKIIEMCYGFDWRAIHEAGGYWDKQYVWHHKPLSVPVEIIKKF